MAPQPFGHAYHTENLFDRVVQGTSMFCPPPAATSTASGFLATVDHWQALLGALGVGLLAVIGALVVAVMIRRRARRIAAAMVLPDLQQIVMAHDALTTQRHGATEDQFRTQLVESLLRRRPRVFALHTQSIGELTDLDTRLYIHLFQCERIHTAFEAGIEACAGSRQDLMSFGFDKPPRPVRPANPAQTADDWTLCAEHAALAHYYLNQLVFGRWPRVLASLRMGLWPVDEDRRSAHLLKTGTVRTPENRTPS